MGFLKGLTQAIDVANKMKQGYMIGKLVAGDRCVAMQEFAIVLHNTTPQQFDEFEITYLNATSAMVGQTHIRAMELYAGLKYLQAQHYGEWQGFVTESKPLADRDRN